MKGILVFEQSLAGPRVPGLQMGKEAILLDDQQVD
jgi:hypothetical protein